MLPTLQNIISWLLIFVEVDVPEAAKIHNINPITESNKDIEPS